MANRRVCFVGTGSIAHTHAEALALTPGTALHAIVEPNPDVGKKFADRWAVPHRFLQLADAIQSGEVDCAHVLAPPPLHRPLAEPLLDAGIPVLVEKPMATSVADCDALRAVAAKRGALLGVNQNYIYNPAFARLARQIKGRKLGRLLGVQAIYSMPLRQMAARQFGHWMFAEPLNILLEQAVHPLSQLCFLTGEPQHITASAGRPVEIAPGKLFFPESRIFFEGAGVPVQLHFAVGRSFPCQQIVAICDDGVATADVLNDRVVIQGRTRWLDALDGMVSGTASGGMMIRDSIAGTARYALSMLRLKGRSDSFFVSMRDSIAAFHAALDRGAAPFSDDRFGAYLVRACDEVARTAFGTRASAPSMPAIRADAAGIADVTLLGGTGFIGSATVKALIDAGLSVTVAARGIRNLPAVFEQPGVKLVQADVSDRSGVERAIGATPLVINLAHGGGGASFAEIERRMVGSARLVADICLERKVKRLVHASTIAALYLGDSREVIVGSTPPDPHPAQRGDYAHAKVLAENALMDIYRDQGLPLVILRPGVVVGEGSSPFHSGLGFFNNDQHCLGWNAGRNPLPFVLVEDVASAVLGALRAHAIEGGRYNLVGDVRPSAADYIAQLAEILGRPLRFHPQAVAKLFSVEVAKWGIKMAGGRRSPLPSLRDLKSRGMVAIFDCADSKRDLAWSPVANRDVFVERAIRVHVPD
jgi:predicted dehydrogenase/nucleoside-diphosphate-sugar epimerase